MEELLYYVAFSVFKKLCYVIIYRMSKCYKEDMMHTYTKIGESFESRANNLRLCWKVPEAGLDF